MGNGSATTTTNQQQTYTPTGAIAQPGQAAASAGQYAAGLPFQMPAAPVAPFTPFQNIGFGETLGAQGMAQPYFGAAANYLQGSAAPVTGQDVSQYYNPMANQVTNQLQNIFGNQMRTLTGNVTQQAGGVGADRIGVAQSNLANQQGLAAGQTLANLYYPALQAAQQQRQMMAGAGFGLGQLGPAAQGSQLQGIQALLGAGGQQQALAQQMMNAQYQQQLGQIAYPFQTAQYLAGITGGLAPALGGTTQGQATTTQTPAQPTGLQTGLGLGVAGLGALGSAGAAGIPGMAGTGAGKGSMPGSNYFSPFMGGQGVSGNAIYNRGGVVEGFDAGGVPALPPAPIGQSGTAAPSIMAPPPGEQEQLNAIYGTMPDFSGLPRGASLYANAMAPTPQLRGLQPLQTTGTNPNIAQLLQNPQVMQAIQAWTNQNSQPFGATSPVTDRYFLQQGGRAGISPAMGMAPWGPPFQSGGVIDIRHLLEPKDTLTALQRSVNILNQAGKAGYEGADPSDLASGQVHVLRPEGRADGGDAGDDPTAIAQAPAFPGASPPKVGGLTPIPTTRLQPGPGKSGLYGQYLSPFPAHQQTDTKSGSQAMGSEIGQGMQLAQSLSKLGSMGSAGAAGAGAPLDLGATAAGKGSLGTAAEAAPLLLAAARGGGIEGYQDAGVVPDPRGATAPAMGAVTDVLGNLADWYRSTIPVGTGRNQRRLEPFGPEAPEAPPTDLSTEAGFPFPRARPAEAPGRPPVPPGPGPAFADRFGPANPLLANLAHPERPFADFSDSPPEARLKNFATMVPDSGSPMPGQASAPGARPSGPQPFRQAVGPSMPFGGEPDYGAQMPGQRPGQRPPSWGQRFADSPFFPLIAAGAAIAGTPGPAGRVAGAGLQAYGTAVSGQRKALDTEDAQNQKAQHLQDMAAQHLRDYQLRSDIAEQRERIAKDREDRLREKEEASPYGPAPRLDHYQDIVNNSTEYIGKTPQEKAQIAHDLWQAATKARLDAIQNRGAPAPPAAPATEAPRQDPKTGKWYRRGPNNEAIEVPAPPTS